MSRRVKKSLGYGIVLPRTKMDELFNLAAKRVRPEDIREELMECTFYAGMSNWDETMFEGTFDDCVSIFDVDPEDNESEVVVLVRPLNSKHTWYRNEDPVDYYQAALENPHNLMETRIQYYDSYIWPYESDFFDVTTGEAVTSQDYQHTKLLAEHGKDAAVKQENQTKLDNLERQIPEAVTVLLTATGFASAETAQTLKPMIATWWS